MAERAVDILIRGKDATAAAWKAASAAVDRFGAAMGRARKQARDWTVIAQGLAGAIRRVNQVFEFAVDAAGKQLAAETRLAVALGRVTKEIDAQVKVYRSWAGAIQVATGVEDDLTLGMAATLQTTGAMPETVRRATMALVDYSKATGRSVNEAMEPLRRSLNGQQAQWSRLGIAVDQSLPPQEQALEVIRQLEAKYGGFAVALGQTAGGSIDRFKAAIGDLREMLGFAILKTDAFNNILDVLGFHLGEIDQEARTNQLAGMLDTLFKGAMTGARAAVLGIMRFGQTVLFFLENISIGIASVIRGLGSLASAVEGNAALKALGLNLEGVSAGLDSAAAQVEEFSDRIRTSTSWMDEAAASVDAFFEALTRGNERAKNMREGGAGTSLNALGQYGANPLPEPSEDLGEQLKLPTESLSEFEQALDQLWIKWSAFQFAGLTFASELSAAFFSISDSAANSVGTLLVDLREKAISGGEAIRKMGNTIANQALASMGRAITKVILAPLDLALQKFVELVTTMIWGAAVEKAIQLDAAAASVAIGVTTAKTLELAWLPVATLVSIATLGGAAAVGASAIIGAFASVKAAAIAAAAPAQLAEGGLVTGPRLALIGEGRYAESVQPLRPGSAMELLSRANGAEEFFGTMGGGNVTVNLTVNGGAERPEELARAVSEAIARELRLLAGRRYA